MGAYCCNATKDETCEIKNLTSETGSRMENNSSLKPSSVKNAENNTTFDFGGVTPIAGASGMTKNSSSAQVNNAGNKKVL